MAIPADVALPAFLCAALWGFGPILSKRGLEHGGTPRVAAAVIIVTSTVLFWVSGVFISGSSFLVGLSAGDVLVFLAAGVFGTALGRILYYFGVDRIGASVNAAGLNTRPLFVLVLGAVLVGESVAPKHVVGILVLVGGVVVLSASKGGDIRGWHRRSLLFPLVAAFAFGLGNVIRKYGLTTSPATPLEAVTLNESGAILLLVGYAALHRHEFSGATPRVYGYFIANGILSAVGLLALFVAIEAGPVTLVDPLAGTAPLFTTLFAAIFLRDIERVTPSVVLGALGVTAGAGIVTFV